MDEGEGFVLITLSGEELQEGGGFLLICSTGRQVYVPQHACLKCETR